MNTIRLLFLWLAGLAPALAQDVPIRVGVVISQSGAHADLATEYLRALELWRDEANAAGGLLGRPVELRVLDDGSSAVRNGPLYAQLIREEKVDLLVGPYGSAATLIAAAEAERARRVMVNGSGTAAVVHSRGPKYLFQSALPNAAYGTGVLRIAADAGYPKLFIVARDDAASQEMAQATHNAAAAHELSAAAIEIYKPGTTDFTVQVARARAAGAQAWIAFGDVRDAAEMVKTFRKLDYAPALFFARAASHSRYIALLGQDAEFSLGAVDFDPRLGDAARAFAKAYAARWTVPPGMPAAQGYAAGTVLGAAVRNAGTLDQERLATTLAAIEVPTVLGPYKVSYQNGVQVGAQPRVIQIREGRPEFGDPLLPYPQWNERAPIKK